MFTEKIYRKILQHLFDKGLGFCFYQGVLVSRDDCAKAIGLDKPSLYDYSRIEGSIPAW